MRIHIIILYTNMENNVVQAEFVSIFYIKSVVIASSFLICSPLFLQVTRTTIKSRMGSKFGRIQLGTYELAALQRLENPHRLIMGETL